MTTALATFTTGFAHRYTKPDEYPTESWDQKCALLMARIGLAKHGLGWHVAPRIYGNADAMAAATAKRTPLNKDSTKAPIGAFHFWSDHVGLDVNGGGTTLFMATTHLAVKLEIAIGYQSETGYTKYAKSIGWKYLGWADNYNGGKYKLPVEVSTPTPPTVTVKPQQGTLSPKGVLLSFDADTTQAKLDFTIPYKGTHDAPPVIKFSGDNKGPKGGQHYIAPNAVAQTKRARAAGYTSIGFYHVPDKRVDAAKAGARFATELLKYVAFNPVKDFIWLDLESLDKSLRYSDAQAATFLLTAQTVLKITIPQTMCYIGLAVARENKWPHLLASGVPIVIAAYNTAYRYFNFTVPTIPKARIVGHQYADNGTFGTVHPIDLDEYVPTAFPWLNA